MKGGNKVFQVTENIFLNSKTLKFYDLVGNYIGHLKIETNELIYNEDLPDELKSELGVFLMTLNSVEIAEA